MDGPGADSNAGLALLFYAYCLYVTGEERCRGKVENNRVHWGNADIIM